MKKTLLLTAAILFLTGACRHHRNAGNNSPKQAVRETALANGFATLPTDEGYELLKQRCYICHKEKPAGDMQQMTAPPMMGVKRHYLEKYPGKADFVQAITDWVKKPEKSRSLMPGAVKRFGLMPAFPYSDDDLKKIATAIYDRIPLPRNHRHGRCGGGKCGGGKCGGSR